MIQEGDRAPDFTLADHTGSPVSLSDFAGKPVVVYFYPRDDTPGCTTEACGFRDNHDAIIAKGAVVIGISPDDPTSHVAFREKFALPFPLLCDPSHEVIEAFGVWGAKERHGKTYEGVVRSTFIVGKDGVVVRAWPTVNPADHAAEVLAAL